MPSSAKALVLNPTVATVCNEIVGEQNVYLRPQELHCITGTGDVDALIARKVASTMVQSCGKDGFVLSGASSSRAERHSNHALYKPLRILTRSAGEVPAEHLNGAFVYKVCYQHYVCNPPIDVVLPAVVCEKNKLGIRAHYYPYAYDTEHNEVASGDVLRASANFLVVFLPKALHMTTQMSAGDDGDDHDDAMAIDDDTTLTPQELYEREEKRIDTPHEGRETIVHVRILQKRFDINDKQISAVGVLAKAS